MKQACWVGAALLSVASCNVWAVYKCPDSSGKTIFQDLPCIDGQVVEAKPSLGASSTIERLQRLQRQGPTASNSSDPLVGVGKNHLLQIMGPPASEVSTTGYDGSILESLTFLQHGKAVNAHLKNGFVTRTSTYESALIRQAGTPYRSCPTELDIKNAETAASSITISRSERWEKERAVRRMKACLD